MILSALLKPVMRALGIAPRAAQPPAAGLSDGTRVVLDAFTELAPQYETTMNQELGLLWGVSYGDFVDRFIATVPLKAGARILDVATGTAMIPLHITRQAPGISHVVGLDITPAMLARGQENVRSADQSSRIWLVCGSGMEIPFDTNAFDVVTCGLGMHHMQAEELVIQMQRVLNPDGWLLMADVGAAPMWRSFMGKLAVRAMLLYFGLRYSRVRIRAETDAIENLRTASEWRTFLTEAGFTDITITEMPGRRSFYPSGLLIKARAESG